MPRAERPQLDPRARRAGRTLARELERASSPSIGGRAEVLADGSVVVTLSGSGAATDQAAQAARCALALRTILPNAPMALATGRGVVDRSRAGRRGDRSRDRACCARPPAAARDAGASRSASTRSPPALLDARFAIGGDAHGLVLCRASATSPSGARTLLGKPTPCVGRERELGDCSPRRSTSASPSRWRAPCWSPAPAGVGKSRLRYELVRRLARDRPLVEVWIGRGDPMSAGSPFGLLAQALRRAAGIVDGEPLAVRQPQAARARAAPRRRRRAPTRVTEFLGELRRRAVSRRGQRPAARRAPGPAADGRPDAARVRGLPRRRVRRAAGRARARGSALGRSCRRCSSIDARCASSPSGR